LGRFWFIGLDLRRRPAPDRRHVDFAAPLIRIFQKALKRRNVVAALAAPSQLPQLSLLDALELTALIARKEPNRYPRVAAAGCSAYSKNTRT
jgi:hypothetical protein